MSEGVPVTGKPVIVDRGETLDHECAVAAHTPPDQEIGLLFEAQGGLRVLHDRCPEKRKNPP